MYFNTNKITMMNKITNKITKFKELKIYKRKVRKVNNYRNIYNYKLIKIKEKNNYWELYFRNEKGFMKVPLYRLPNMNNKNFVNFKVKNYYTIEWHIKNLEGYKIEPNNDL